MKTSALIALITGISALSPAVPRALAAPEHEHGHSHAVAETVVIPGTRPELWRAIQSEHASLLAAIEQQSDGAAHLAEEKLQAYLKALPEKAADLEEGVRRRIEGQARNLARAYDSVHHASDAKAWDKAAAEMKKAVAGMTVLSAQMPE